MIKTDLSSYRKDIDGLRGLAVLAVFLFHLFPQFLPGGYVGVDVFFVISGFLITGILRRELETKTFSFKSFYTKRILRLLPSLLLVLLASLFLGYFWLLPDEFSLLGKHVFGAASFSSNFFLLSEKGYFDVSSAKKVLLHLWSLAVEEQFYLFWPLFLVVLYRFNKTNLHQFVLLALFVLSFLGYVYVTDRNPDQAFYLPHLRFWQILAGAIICVIPTKKTDNLPAYLAGALLLSSFFIKNITSNFDMWAAIIAVFSCSTIIGLPETTLNRKILGNPTLQYTGLISYPLYLWHWPIIVFSRLSSEGHSSSKTAFEAILSVVLAIITYHVVEKPIAKMHDSARRKLIWLLIPALAIIGIIGSLMWQEKFRPYSTSVQFTSLSDAATDWDYPTLNLANIEIKPEDVPINKVGSLPPHVLFIGDSHMEQYYPRIKFLSEQDKSISAAFITGGACVPVPGVINKIHRSCQTILNQAIGYALTPEIHTIVLASQWHGYFVADRSNYYFRDQQHSLKDDENLDAAFREFEAMISSFRHQNKKVYIVLNTPVGNVFSPHSMIKRDFPFQTLSVLQPPFYRKSFDQLMSNVNARMSKIAAITGATLIQPLDFLCNGDICATHIDGVPRFKDDQHMRPEFVRKHVHYLDQVFLGKFK